MSNTLKDKMGIYQIVNLINGKKYVGSSQNLYNRKIRHFSTLRNNKHRNCHLQNAFNKYGEDNFSFEVIEFVDTIDELLPREQYYIELYQVCNKTKGYNIIVDAVRHTLSEETKQKISLAKRGNKHPMYGKRGILSPLYGKTLSKETKLKISLAQRGKTFSKETKLKISLANKGKTLSEETKQKISLANKGRIHSEEAKRKMSLAKRGKYGGEKHPMYGKHHSLESRRKMSLANKGDKHPMYGKRGSLNPNSKKVICVETGIIYYGIHEASRVLNICFTSICKCCRGEQKTAGGYHWQYYNPS